MYTFFLLACSHPKGNTANSIKNEIKSEKKTVIQAKERADTIKCKIAINIDAYLQEIISTPAKFINNLANDNCVLAIVKTISDKSIVTGEEKYLDALNAICGISDGYLSEYFLEIGIYQFYHNFQNLTKHLVNKGQKYCFRKVIIESVSMEMSVGGQNKTAEINHYLDNKLKGTDLPNEISTFIKEMRKEFDSSMFD